MAAKTYLVNPDGQTVLVPANEEERALSLGFTRASGGQIDAFNKEFERIQKYSTTGQAIAAGAEAAADWLTIGLSTKAEELVGITPEEIKARAELNPIASGVGSAVGLIGPALLTGGISAEAQLAGRTAALAAEAAGAGRAAQALAAGRAAAMAPAASNLAKAASFTAPGLATRAGAGLSAVSSALMPATGAVGKALSATAASAIGNAGENALLEAGNAAGDAMLGDPDLTAESFVHRVGLSALLGGAVGAGIVGVPVGSRALRDAVRGTETAKKYAEKFGEYEAKQLFTAAGGTPGEMKNLMRQMDNSKENVYKMVQEGYEMGLVSHFGNPASKVERIDNTIERTGQALRSFIDEADSKLTDLTRPRIQDVIDRVVEGPLRSLQKDFTNQAAAQEMRSVLDSFANTYREAPSLSSLQEAKELLQKKVFGYSQMAFKDQNATAAASAYDDFRHIVKKYLDESMDKVGVGSDTAKTIRRQAEVAYKLRRLATLSEAKQAVASTSIGPAAKAWVIGSVLGDPGTGVAMATAFEGVRRFGGPSLGYLSGALSRALAEDAPAALVQDLKLFAQQQADAMRATVPLGPIPPAQTAKLEYIKLMDEIGSTIDKMRANQVRYPGAITSELADLRKAMWQAYSKGMSPAQAAKQVKVFEDQLNDLAMPSKEMLAINAEASDEIRRLRDTFRVSLANAPTWGRKYANDAALAARRAADIMVEPERMLALEGLQQISADLKSQVKSQADDFLQRVTPYAAAATRVSPAYQLDKPMSAKEIVAAAQAKREPPKAEQIANNAHLLLSNPERMEHVLSSLGDDIGYYAPKTSDAIKMTAARAISFIAEKAPKSIPMGPGMPDLPANKTDLLKFQRYLQAIDNPLLVIQHAKSGMVTPEEVEAVQAVYPRLFQEIRAELTSALVDDSADRPSLAPLSYNRRMGLSMLLKSNMTGMMKPSVYMGAQSAYRTSRNTKPPQAKVAKPIPVSRIENMNVSGRAAQETAAYREAQEGARLA